jgi:pimeloyl-ACP methyl ester carboxylesterase
MQAVYSSFTPFHRGGAGPPLVCLHGFTDTWRTWDLVLPALERHHDVLAPTLLGHAGGPEIDGEVSDALLVDAVERAMDEAGFQAAHIVGNSLGGYIALRLAERARALSVVVLAPAGGYAEGDDSSRQTLAHFATMQAQVKAALPHADSILSTADGRRRVTSYITSNFEHIPVELLAHQMRGVAECSGVGPLIELGLRTRWSIDPQKITCPVRVVWGTADRILEWPGAAARYRDQLLAQAEWIELEDVGHLPQLDVPLETTELILGFTAGRSVASPTA